MPQATATTDPYAVPTTIDIPYLNRVFVALEKINGDATRLIVANKRITPEAAALLHAILTDEEFKIQADIWNDYIDQGLPGMPPNPGDRKTTVTRIVRSMPSCVGLEVLRDYNALRTEPAAPGQWQVTLVPTTQNPTRWAISEDLKRGAALCAL